MCLLKLSIHSTICFILITFCICANRGAQLDFNGNSTKCSWLHRIIHFHHKKGGADKFKALQHIKAKSYKLRANLVDFGGTAQKEQLVYLARGAMSMSELMVKPCPFHNRRHLIFWNGKALWKFNHWCTQNNTHLTFWNETTLSNFAHWC